MPQRPPVAAPPGIPSQRDRARRATDPTRKLYGRHRHRSIRARLLRLEPLCRSCRRAGLLVPATVRDHVVPLTQGGADTLENSQPLCTPCHNRKTSAERTARR